MEDVKEDKKDDKTINFHQMELDDRILKVKLVKHQNYNLTNKNKNFKIPSGDSETRLDHTDVDSRESNSADTRIEGRPHSCPNRIRKDRFLQHADHPKDSKFEGICEGAKDDSADPGTEQGTLPADPQSRRGFDDQVQQNHSLRESVSQRRTSGAEASPGAKARHHRVDSRSHPHTPEPEEHQHQGQSGDAGD